MNSIAEVIPSIVGEIQVTTEEEILADEARWQEQQDNRQRLVFDATRASEMDRMNIPPKVADYLSKPFDFTKQMPDMTPADWKRIADAWMEGKAWITLLGDTGVGKTDVATRLLVKKRRHLIGLGAERFLFLDATEDIRILADRFGPDTDALWDRIKYASFILLDDVGYATPERHISAVRQIIMSADKSGAILIITSNHNLNGLGKMLEGAAMSRITATPNQVFVIKGRDIRQEVGK